MKKVKEIARRLEKMKYKNGMLKIMLMMMVVAVMTIGVLGVAK